MRTLGVFFGVLTLSGCVAVFNNPESTGSGQAESSSSGSTSSTEVTMVTFDSWPVNNRVGWLKKITGTCVGNGVSVVVSSDSASASDTCDSNTFSVYLDVSALSTGTLTVTATHNGGSNTTTLEKYSSNCDDSADRAKNYAAGMAGGAGTEASPYVVCTADQLNEVRNGLDKVYSLENDIYFENGDSNGDGVEDGSDTDYRSGTGWTALGTFSGRFNGNHFLVNQLKIDRSGTSTQGLFGYVLGSSAPAFVFDTHVRNGWMHTNGTSGLLAARAHRSNIVNSSATGTLLCESTSCGGFIGSVSSAMVVSSWADVNVTSNSNYVGGFVGSTDDTANFYDCAADGDVDGGEQVGGFVGRFYKGLIYNAYAKGNVSGDLYVGGFAGYHRVAVYNSFATGDVTSSAGYAGGFGGGTSSGAGDAINSFATGAVTGDAADTTVGLFSAETGTFTGSVYYSGATCNNLNGGGSCNSLGTAEATLSDLYDPTEAPLSNWDFYGSYDSTPSDHWHAQSGDFPTKWYRSNTTFILETDFGGSGTYSDPFEISTADQLNSIGSNPMYMGSYFELTASFNASGIGNFNVIAYKSAFAGSIFGNGNTVSSLTINVTENYAGLVGYMCGGTINNLSLTGMDIDGVGRVGGVVGSLFCGTITQVNVTGTIDTTSSYTGGIVGTTYIPVVLTDLSVDATINSGGYAGGIAGYTRSATAMERVSFEGSIAGGSGSRVGGIVGSVQGLVGLSDCYVQATNVSGNYYIGGVYGYSFGGMTVSRCYSTADVSANISAGGFAGSISNDTITNSFATGSVSGSTATTQVGLFLSEQSGATLTDNYVFSGSTCTNSGAGIICNVTGYIGVAPVSTFYDSTNAPMNGVWDFGSVWQDNSGSSAYPTLQ